MMESVEKFRVNLSVATLADLEDVFALRLRARKTDPGYFPTSYEEELAKSLEAKEKWLSNPKQLVTLAKSQGKSIGMMAAREREVGTWYLHGVYVVPEFRGRNVADSLMRFLVASIKRNPEARILTFQVEATNTPALNFYKKHGFELVGEDTQVLGDGLEHQKYVMQQEIEKITF